MRVLTSESRLSEQERNLICQVKHGSLKQNFHFLLQKENGMEFHHFTGSNLPSCYGFENCFTSFRCCPLQKRISCWGENDLIFVWVFKEGWG